VAVAVGAGLRHVHATHVPDVLAAAAILDGLIFNVFVLCSDLTARAAEKADPHTSARSTSSPTSCGNVSYAVLLAWF